MQFFSYQQYSHNHFIKNSSFINLLESVIILGFIFHYQILLETFRGVLGHFYGDIPFMESDEHCVPGMVELVGAKSCLEVAVMNSLTVNIHLLFTAFYRPTKTRFKILLEDRAFPSDHYAIESQLALHRIDPKHGMICLKPRKVAFWSKPTFVLPRCALLNKL